MEILLKKTTLQSDICLIAYLSYNVRINVPDIYDVSI